MSTTADVIIIGGGISGCSTAYQLTRRGARVRLLEKSHLAAGCQNDDSVPLKKHGLIKDKDGTINGKQNMRGLSFGARCRGEPPARPAPGSAFALLFTLRKGVAARRQDIRIRLESTPTLQAEIPALWHKSCPSHSASRLDTTTSARMRYN